MGVPFEVIVPQLGEGLQEVRIVRRFKHAGDDIARDELLFEMETDKAVVQVESACAGRIVHWLVREGDVVPVGATIAHIEPAQARSKAAGDDLDPMQAPHALDVPPGRSAAGDGDAACARGERPRIPPRTRAYCRQLGIAPEVMVRIPARSSRLLPEDVDRWRSEARRGSDADARFVTRPLGAQQRALNRRFKRSAGQAVPATLRRELPWAVLEARLGRLRAGWPRAPLSPLAAIAHAAAQAAAAHPRFRSAVADEGSLRESRHVTLGVAVERPGDELVTAAIEDADTLDPATLADALQGRIRRALDGEDQSAISPHVLLTDLAGHGVVDAVPVLVAPAAAVLFIGAPFGQDGAQRFNLVLTFDHRLTNGAGAARFLDTLVEHLSDAETSGEAGARAALPAGLAARVRERLAGLLGMTSTDALDPRRPLRSYGLTSLVAVEMARRLEDDLGLTLPATLVWNHPTLEAITGYLAARLERGGGHGERKSSGVSAVPASAAAARVRSEHAAGREPIAIVGLGCRFPGADGPEAFWRLIADGRDAVRDVPSERWDIDAVYDPDPGAQGRMITRSGGFLDDVDQFDPAFFGISQREAAGMDPQQRVLLEVAWEALEHAGIPPHRLAGSETGVFVGNCFNDYFTLLAGPPTRGGSGTLTSILANRVSYFLDLRGPSLVVDTACSSSLVAIDLACGSLRDGTSSLALAGGVNVILSPRMHMTFSQAGMMAPDGRCKTFDARADGYGRGEGCGIVVLKRLSDARAAGNRVLAIIRGTAVNQDGATNGISAPNGFAQQAVIRRALADAGVDPASISLVEAHGTGTPLGDAIEVEALRAVYGAAGPHDEGCVLGSVKTNVGHLEAAAGVAGLMKLVLCLQHEATPPHLHFRSPNPHLPLDGTRFVISRELRPWPRRQRARLASVSSFGVGGTNVHAILEEAPRDARPDPPERDGYVLPLSARNDKALADLVHRYCDMLGGPVASIGEICRAAGTGRSHFPVRLAIACRSVDQLRARLAAAASGVDGAGVHRGRRAGHAPPGIGLFFPPGASSDGARHAERQRLIEMWRRLGVQFAAVVDDDGTCGGPPSTDGIEMWLTRIAPDVLVVARPGTSEAEFDGDSSRALLDTAASLYARGVDIDWTAFDPVERGRPDLPTYPFQRRRCWLEPDELLSWRATESPT